MKFKVLTLLISIALLCFASCTDEAQELANEQSQALKQIVMTTQDFQLESDSRTLYEIGEAVKCTWAANDTVGVFPEEGAQAYFPMASGAGTKNATFDGKGWALKDGRTYGAYYPCIGKFYLDRNAAPVNYSGQTQKGDASTAHLGTYDYMVAAPTTSEFGSAQFMFKHLSSLIQLRITVPQPATLTSVKLVADTKAFAVEGTVDIMADAPSITSTKPANEIVLNLQDVATNEENQVVTLYMMIPPVDLSEQSLKAMIASDKGTQEIAFEGKEFKAGTAYGLLGAIEDEGATGDGTYKDGVVSLAEAGTMAQLLGDDMLNITTLKVVGPINGDDVRCLRQMLGGSEFYYRGMGELTSIDLSEATIVSGGKAYYLYDGAHSYGTSNNIIGPCMFYCCEKLQTIILPSSVTSISIEAFYGCNSLSSVTMGNCVTSIGMRAFMGCDSLFFINLSNSIISIGKFAFQGCRSLKHIELPEGVTTIKEGTFNGCSSLVSISLPGVTSIGVGAFRECASLASIALPNVTSIDTHSFYDCSSLSSIVFSDNLVSIGRTAFFNCQSLAYIDIPEGVSSIESFTFYGCESLAIANIGKGVTSIGRDAFSNCSALAIINIPNGITSIGEDAFYNCPSLSSVYISDLSAWCNIAFNGLYSNPLSNEANLYLNNKKFTYFVVPEEITEIKDFTFHGCMSLTDVSLGDGVTSIGNYAFRNCSTLTNVIVGDGLTSIGEEAFFSCESLELVSIGKNTTSVGNYAFRGCFELTNFYCHATTPPSIDLYPLNYFGNETTLYVPQGCGTKYRSSNWGINFQVIKE